MARLKAQTRFSLAPYQGSVITFGRAPLKGRVGRRGFTVSLNQRDWLTLLQPTARGRIVQDERGTRVEVTAGIPPLLLWYLRFAVVFAVPFIVLGVGGALAAAGLSWAAVAGFSTFLLFMLGMLVFGVGVNMNNVEGQLDALAAQVEAALVGDPPPQPSSESSREAARRAAAAQQRLRT